MKLYLLFAFTTITLALPQFWDGFPYPNPNPGSPIPGGRVDGYCGNPAWCTTKVGCGTLVWLNSPCQGTTNPDAGCCMYWPLKKG